MRAIQSAATAFLVLALAACGGGGGGGSPAPTPTFSVGGTVANLTAGTSLVLQLNGGDDTTVTGNNAFTFSTPVASGSNFAVTVKSEPVSLSCTVANGSGTMGGANITNVAVTCGIAKYSVNVTINGMPYGQSITLLNNGTDTLARSVNGTASFPTAIDYGQPYSVTVSQPPAQPTCSLVGATAGVVSGTVNGPINVVYDCPHFAYATNQGDGTLSTYKVVNATGGLTVSAANPFTTIASPYLITTNPNQAFAYVTAIATGGIDVYSLDSVTGALSANSSNPFTPGVQSYGLAFDPTGAYAIQPNYAPGGGAGSVSVFTVNNTVLGAGALSASPVSTRPSGILPDAVAVAVTPHGNYVYVPSGSGGTLYRYALASNGVLTSLTGSSMPVPGADVLAGAATDPSGSFVYVGGNTTYNVFGFSINATTGALTPIAGSPFNAGANPSAVTIHPNGKFLYVANYGSQSVSGYTITPGSGVLVPMAGSPYTTGISPESLTIGPTGEYAYVVNTRYNTSSAGTVSVFAIDQTTGVLKEISGSPFAAGTNPQTIMIR